MDRQKYRIYIISYSGKVKLYWNRILQAWVDYEGNASPFKSTELNKLPFAVRSEPMPDEFWSFSSFE